MLRLNKHTFLFLASILGAVFVAKNYLLYSVDAAYSPDEITAYWQVRTILGSISRGSWIGGGSLSRFAADFNRNLNSFNTSGKINSTDLTNALALLDSQAVIPLAGSGSVSTTTLPNAWIQAIGNATDGAEKLKDKVGGSTASGLGFLANSPAFLSRISTASTAQMDSFAKVALALGINQVNVVESAFKAALQRGAAAKAVQTVTAGSSGNRVPTTSTR